VTRGREGGARRPSTRPGLRVHDQVHPIGAVERQPLVRERDGDLATERNASKSQLVAKARLISRFQEPGPELAVNLDASSDHSVRAVGELGQFPVVRCHLWYSAASVDSCDTDAPRPLRILGVHQHESERAGGNTGRRGVWKAGGGQASRLRWNGSCVTAVRIGDPGMAITSRRRFTSARLPDPDLATKIRIP